MKKTKTKIKSKTKTGGVLPPTSKSPNDPNKIEKIKIFSRKNGDSKEK